MVLANHEILIFDQVFDVKKFATIHPGGSDILVYGSKNVESHFVMHHPFMSNDRALRALQPYKIRDRCTTDIDECGDQYKYDTPFAKDLKQQVQRYFKGRSHYANNTYWFQLMYYLILYMMSMLYWIYSPCLLSAVLFGFGCYGIALNIMHDANHGSLSKNPFVNQLFGYLMNVLGSSRILWIQGHNVLHHAYVNHLSCDPDLYNFEPLVTFTTTDDTVNENLSSTKPFYVKTKRWYHQYQHFLLPLYAQWFYLSTIFDVSQYTIRHEAGSIENKLVRRERIINILTKLISWYINFFPLFHYTYLNDMGLCYILFLIYIRSTSFSLLLVVPFELSHHFEHAQHSNKDKNDKIDWYQSQVESSSTYGGKMAGFLTGGLNYQIEHHLFPVINSIHYPYISPIIRSVCVKHNVNYTYFPTVWDNLRSTMSYLKKVGSDAA